MLKRILIGLAVVFVTAIAAVLIMKARADARVFEGYYPNLPLNAQVRFDEDTEKYRRVEFTIDAQPLAEDPLIRTVPVIMCMPKDEGPHPALIFLHGIGQKKDFVEEIAAPFVREGFAILSQDQYTRGERRLNKPEWAETGLGQVRWGLIEGNALTQRAAMNVLETRRIVDYLQDRPDIDPDRIYLMGASFGAITGATAAAKEPRLRAAVLCYGGGHLPTLLDSRISRQYAGGWLDVVIPFASWYASALDPAKHVGEIAPRPVLIQNGSYDQVVPAESGRKLYEAANEPKDFVLYDSDHIGLDPVVVVQVLNDTLDWIKEQDAALNPTVAEESSKDSDSRTPATASLAS